MSNNHDDPRLTAYALGELDAAERAAVEQQIGESVETLLEIEAIREVAGQLRAALREEAPVSSASMRRLPAHATPTLASVATDVSPRFKSSGKFAVTASCLALVCAFGIVVITGRGERESASNMARRLHRLNLYDTNGILAMNERGETQTDGELFGVWVELQTERREYSVDSGSQKSFQHNPVYQEAGGGVAGPPRNKGFGDYDGTGIVNGSMVQGSSGVGAGNGRGLGGNSGPGEGFRSRGSGSRHSMLASAGAAATTEASRKLNLPLVVQDSSKSIQPLSRSLSEAEGLQQSPRGRTATYGGGQLHAGRGLPGDVKAGDSKTKVDKFAVTENIESKPRDEVELRLKELKPSFHRPERLEARSAEAYAAIHDNPFATPLQEPLSTFSIDVDTAAYSNMRRFLTQGSWPPADSVRIEEMVNYFSYDYVPPGAEIRNPKSEIRSEATEQPFAVHLEVAGCPWNADHRLVRVGLKGKEIAVEKRPVSNIVFLIDVSGSMQPENKLPLVKAGLRRLVEQFTENDRIGIVVYAGASGLALDSTNATQKDVILSSLENLQAGGSTNGGEGIQLAYALARKNFIPKGTNRVILCTDGDFNVGVTNQDDLTRLIEEESKSGVFLSVLGFGMGNLKDSTLEKLADKGNGNYAYIDTLREANKVFVEQMTGTLITIAKDVKIQIEFNPAQVGAYRLIGYENRMLAAQDFNDDTKDAGEIGAGHTVTALYEVVPPNKVPAPPKAPAEETLKYQPEKRGEGRGARGEGRYKNNETLAQPSALGPQPSASRELLTIKLRYKQPDGDKSSLIEMPLTDAGRAFGQASTDFRFAASVASFGMILRHSPHRGNATLDSVLELAQSSMGADKSGYRSEFVSLVRSAKALSK